MKWEFNLNYTFLPSWVRWMPVERNHVRTTGRAIRDLLTKDIDVRALLNSRVTIVQKVRRSTLWLHRWIFPAEKQPASVLKCAFVCQHTLLFWYHQCIITAWGYWLSYSDIDCYFLDLTQLAELYFPRFLQPRVKYQNPISLLGRVFRKPDNANPWLKVKR